jgi:hypothetical protein
VWNTTPNGGLGGIWQAGTGPASDGNYVFFATGNGTYDGPTAKNDYGDTVAKVPAQKAVPHKYDYFTPYNQANFEHFDTDVGSGGVLLLPDQGQGAPHQHLLVQVGKSGSIYLINRDRMGLYNSGTNQIVQDMEGAIGGLWSTPGWWNNNVYFGGAGDVVRQYSFDPQFIARRPVSDTPEPTQQFRPTETATQLCGRCRPISTTVTVRPRFTLTMPRMWARNFTTPTKIIRETILAVR